MTEQEKLYETLGELLYAIAKADGVIQKEEKEAMKTLLQGHAWAEQVNWSFEYEVSKEHPVEDIYKKVISYCQSYGPAPQYAEFIEAMKIVAKAADGTQKEESDIITSFSKDLISKFQQDIDEVNNQ